MSWRRTITGPSMAVHSAIKNSIEKAFAGLIDNLVAETSTENNRL